MLLYERERHKQSDGWISMPVISNDFKIWFSLDDGDCVLLRNRCRDSEWVFIQSLVNLCQQFEKDDKQRRVSRDIITCAAWHWNSSEWKWRLFEPDGKRVKGPNRLLDFYTGIKNGWKKNLSKSTIQESSNTMWCPVESMSHCNIINMYKVQDSQDTIGLCKRLRKRPTCKSIRQGPEECLVKGIKEEVVNRHRQRGERSLDSVYIHNSKME
jgi:hypothetical protein